MDLSNSYKSDKIKYYMNVLVFIYTFLFLTRVSILNKNYQSYIHWSEALIALILLILFVIKWLKDTRENKIKWIKDNYWVLIYLVLGLITFAYNGFTYSIARTLFVEAVYLLILTTYICDSTFIKKYIFMMVIIFNLIFNILPFIANIIIGVTNYDINFIKFLDSVSYISSPKVLGYSCFYANPNAMGIMSAMCLIFAAVIYDKNRGIKYKILFAMYFIFTSFNLMVSECRSALLALIFAVFAYIFIRIFKIKAKYMVSFCLISLVVACIGIIGFAHFNYDTGLEEIGDSEKKLISLSSDRYVIWKSTYMAQKDAFFIGKGSIKHVVENRDEYVLKNFPNYYSYKLSKEEPELQEDMLKYGFHVFSDTVDRGNLLYNIYHLRYVINNYDKFFQQNVIENQDNSDLKSLIKENNTAKKHNNIINGLDTHNGYLSILFCSGFFGLIIFAVLMNKKILTSDILKDAKWCIPVVYILVVNAFESALIVDRYFVCIFLFLVLALKRDKTSNDYKELKDSVVIKE